MLPAHTKKAGELTSTSPPLTVEQTVLARLGGEHIAHTVYRHGLQGDSIVGWGRRILEWPTAAPHTLTEVVPQQPDRKYSNGGCVMDVDGDGVEELVIARGMGNENRASQLYWFKEIPGCSTWAEHHVADLGTGTISPHDILSLRFRNEQGVPVRGVILVLARHHLAWFEIPADIEAPWIRHEIGTFPTDTPQSGMAVGDIAGNGRPDVACGMFWAECPADPMRQPWMLHRYGGWDENGWGGMAKTALGDLDGDGNLEIVATEAEIPNARLGVFKREPGQPGGLWNCRLLESDLYCPHSLILADLNRDGRPDILVGEMTAGGWDFPLNPHPRLLAYLHRDAAPFDRSVLIQGWGVHEMGLSPQQQPGQVVVYAADEIQLQKFPQMQTHVSCWSIRVAG